MQVQQRIAITGSTGRLGRLLRLAWDTKPPPGLAPLWLRRSGASGPDELTVDLERALPVLPEGCIILHLAGTVSRGRESSDHAALARAAISLAERAASRHLFIASSAAVYGASDSVHDEFEAVTPVSAYGRAKLAAETAAAGRPATTCLRIGNVAGADAVLGSAAARYVLDPVLGQADGPVRSYIGPRTLIRVLSDLVGLALRGESLPAILNVAQDPPVGMAALLRAAGRNFEWGQPNPAAIARVELGTHRLRTLVPGLPRTSASGLVCERDSLPDWKP